MLPDTITEIPENAFNSAVNMETITLPSGLKTIGNRAFYNTGLTSVTLPDFVEAIGDSAFQGAIHMTSVDLPSGLKTLGEGAFCDAYSLKSVVIPKGITEIPAEAFAGCIALESVSLPEGITSIGNYAFDLTTEIKRGTWGNPDPQLKSINIPSTVISLGESFLGGLKPDKGTALILQGADPSIFTEDALLGITGEGMESPAIYYPTEAKEAYTADGSPLKDLLPVKEATGDSEQDFSLTLPDKAVICPDQIFSDLQAVLPKGAELKITSGDSNVVKVENGAVAGMNTGKTTLTVSILLNGASIDSDTCEITVGHSLTKTEAEAASCTKAGHEAYWSCGVCNKLFADENAEAEIEAPTELPKTDHSYGDGWQSSDAEHWHECAACHEKADAAGHTFKWVIDQDATETEAGYKHEECEICGHKLAAVEIPKTEVPQTGDASTALWIMLFALAGAALTAGTLYFRKRGA